MSHVTTHVLDTTTGEPAHGVPVILRTDAGQIAEGLTDDDGRIRDLGPDRLPEGDYRLVFDTDTYFAASGRPAFYPTVHIEFRITDTEQHYHVPLLLSPFAYSTYRGS